MDTLIRILVIASLLVGLLDLVLLAIVLWTRYVKGRLVVLEARMERMRQERAAFKEADALVEEATRKLITHHSKKSDKRALKHLRLGLALQKKAFKALKPRRKP